MCRLYLTTHSCVEYHLACAKFWLQLTILLQLNISHAFAVWAALEQLCDVAREKGHDRANAFAIILHQSRPLMGYPTFQQVLVKLLGSDEEVVIAKEIQKAVKQTRGVWPGCPHLFQVPVLVIKQVQLFALIVVSGAISLGHVGGLKTYVNSIEKRCNYFLFLA